MNLFLKKLFIVVLLSIIIVSMSITFIFLYNKNTGRFLEVETYLGLTRNTAKEISLYLLDELNSSNYNLAVGSVEMTLDQTKRGVMQIIFIEENSDLIFANIDTKKNTLCSIKYYGKKKKLHPGKIDIKKWIVDSDEAIEIAEKFYNDEKDFKYEEIFIKTCSYYRENIETWDVYLFDRDRNVRYSVRIDPYTKEILQHAIENY